MGVGLWLYQVHVTWHGVYFSSGMVKWEHAAAAAAVVSIRSLLVVLNEGSDLKPMLQHPLSSWTQGGLPSAQTQKHISPHTAAVKLNTGWTASTNTHTQISLHTSTVKLNTGWTALCTNTERSTFHLIHQHKKRMRMKWCQPKYSHSLILTCSSTNCIIKFIKTY